MPKTLIATHYWSNECEVTGTCHTYNEECSIRLDKTQPGALLFADSNMEQLHGAVRLLEVTPDTVRLGTAAETFTVKTNEIYQTTNYTIDGNHHWWYTFQIKDL